MKKDFQDGRLAAIFDTRGKLHEKVAGTQIHINTTLQYSNSNNKQEVGQILIFKITTWWPYLMSGWA